MPEQDKHSKTEDPTPHRLEKAREEGNVFRAQEMISTGLLVAGAGTALLGMPLFFGALKQLTRRILSRADLPYTAVSLMPFIADQLSRIMVLLAVFSALLVLVAIGCAVVQSGWVVTFQPLKPKMERVSPIKGFKRIFSLKGLVELGKSLLKVAVVAPIVYFLIAGNMDNIIGLLGLSLPDVLGVVGDLIALLLIQMITAFVVLTAIDFFYQKWQYKEDLKMTQKEVEDERKEQEGDPQMKGRRREFALELARRPRLDHAVLNSDAVVTNPTHYAVGLRYEPDASDAPQVTVKGIRKRALRIKALAAEHDVPIVENPPLARALHSTVEVEEEIPPELYPAVAAVLAEIYRNQTI